MLKINSLKTFILCISALMVFSCKSPSKEEATPDSKGSDREVMLKNLADEIIIPSYGNFKLAMDEMVSKSNAFTDNPTTTTLNDFRTAWIAAYKEWEKVELFEFGPAESQSLRSFFNLYPANATQIESNISSGSYSLEVPNNYTAQGFPALDYLLYGLGTDDETVVKYTTDANAVKRITYLKNLVSRMNTLFTNVNTAWNASGYSDGFSKNTTLDISGSTSLMVNAYVLNYERYIRTAKIGIPAGVMTAGTTYPDRVEAFYNKNISLDLAKIAHQASVDFFNGKSVKTGQSGPCLKTYLNSIGAKDSFSGDSLTKVVNNQFSVVKSKLDLLGNDLSSEVNNNNQAMVNVYNEMQTVVRLLKIDMTSAMSITITFTDNDGD